MPAEPCRLNPDLLHLLFRDEFFAPVVQFCRVGVGVAGQMLGDFQLAYILQIGGSADGSERVAADAAWVEAGRLGSGFDHAQDGGPAHGPV